MLLIILPMNHDTVRSATTGAKGASFREVFQGFSGKLPSTEESVSSSAGTQHVEGHGGS